MHFQLIRQRRLQLERLEHRRLLAQVSITGSEVDESDSTAAFTLSLDETSDDAITVLFDTVEGTAEAGLDFQPVRSQRVVLMPGELSKTVEVALFDDSTRDPDRRLRGRIQVLGENDQTIPFSEHAIVPGGTSFSPYYDVDESANAFAFLDLGSSKQYFGSSLDGQGTPDLLADSSNTGGIGPLNIVSQGQSVIFLASLESSNIVHLYRSPIDGSASPVRISGPLDSGSIDTRFSDPVLSPDGQYILYPFIETGSDVPQLYAVAVDGNGVPVRLSDPELGVDPGFGRRLLFADNGRVVFGADQPDSDPGVNQLPDPSTLDTWLGYYFDTNNDHIISPRDALFVINRLASQASSPANQVEAEAPAAFSEAFLPLPTFPSDHRDELFRELIWLDELTAGWE